MSKNKLKLINTTANKPPLIHLNKCNWPGSLFFNPPVLYPGRILATMVNVHQNKLIKKVLLNPDQGVEIMN